ncbi:ubiquitin 4A [Paramuricea clavata]|uniref:Ubiquitin 4A n=1 Tax=Paramuricea clavata TaxID=317549 RepID=A0A6S7HX14_PARCT|nr:ubiquitin 4A [Paramuricea clavata]
MKIYVKLLGSQETTIEVDPLDAVSSVKKKIERELDIPCELQRLVFKGSPLAEFIPAAKPYARCYRPKQICVMPSIKQTTVAYLQSGGKI